MCHACSCWVVHELLTFNAKIQISVMSREWLYTPEPHAWHAKSDMSGTHVSPCKNDKTMSPNICLRFRSSATQGCHTDQEGI